MVGNGKFYVLIKNTEHIKDIIARNNTESEKHIMKARLSSRPLNASLNMEQFLNYHYFISHNSLLTFVIHWSCEQL